MTSDERRWLDERFDNVVLRVADQMHKIAHEATKNEIERFVPICPVGEEVRDHIAENNVSRSWSLGWWAGVAAVFAVCSALGGLVVRYLI